MSDYNPTDSIDDIRVIFKRFDFGNKGYIDENDLKRVASIVGEEMTDKEINDLLKISENNQVQFDEFYKVLTKKSFGFY